ncbi:hypothetical protein SAICODRAFT_72509 [Saitoella complicata NRRL Y-17804]|uniref:PCI domain-containing protein n=1 Tax=Saitoella complicata (strain BCRC 22490 / CBS 7301 / JCM 7358 / NBRC 10748 / NRRL Y-17804) TaxID=698492 RepID=A0A0E9ND17_SAICN|nr:uncharacterized protein SAICODRAFT_72509 [Saitoella complicata NRRL Y-17804]ODQ51555.1 hypothetical protein SAICODRAFT_72509 [Saitoella complicata NRRL Y-17804]GAO47305.1 hypothetical protein G7K_1514-t1 [Saitoella complicata NRRL Y-17804]
MANPPPSWSLGNNLPLPPHTVPQLIPPIPGSSSSYPSTTTTNPSSISVPPPPVIPLHIPPEQLPAWFAQHYPHLPPPPPPPVSVGTYPTLEQSFVSATVPYSSSLPPPPPPLCYAQAAGGVVMPAFQPAFTAVNAKKTISKPKPGNVVSLPTTQASSPPSAGKTEWPESLKAFVNRAFSECPDDLKHVLEREVKDIVTSAFEQNIVWTTNWDLKTVPCLEGRKKKDADKKRKKGQNMNDKSIGLMNPGERDRREKRARRFEEEAAAERAKTAAAVPPPPTATDYEADGIDWDQHTIIGYSTTLEKKYLRLTSAPDPSTVRPLHILKDALELVKAKWRKDNNYSYVCDQFKSMRQDLTVQRIRNGFSVSVYETHARIALEKGDLGEYNQCQTQLQQLYALGIDGHPTEFLAYRILYFLYARSRTEVNDVLTRLTEEDKKDPNVRHALGVRKALTSGNYRKLFRLYMDVPNMGAYLMDNFVERERVRALCVMAKSYRPTLDVRFITEELGFENDVETVQFLEAQGVQQQILREGANAGKWRVQMRESMQPLENARARAFKVVDIKGQI